MMIKMMIMTMLIIARDGFLQQNWDGSLDHDEINDDGDDDDDHHHGHWITLTLAHLRIGYLVGNPEVGNSEYVGHQDCPPQPLCFFAQFIRYMGPG